MAEQRILYSLAMYKRAWYISKPSSLSCVNKWKAVSNNISFGQLSCFISESPHRSSTLKHLPNFHPLSHLLSPSSPLTTAMSNPPQPTILPATKDSVQNCTNVSEYCPVDLTIYGYYPNLGANAFFCAFFALCLGIQLVLGIRYKTWTYLVALGFGCLGEAIGMPIHIHSITFPTDIHTRLCRKNNAPQQPLVEQRIRNPDLLSHHLPCLHHRRCIPHPQTHRSRARRQFLPHPT